MYFHAHHKKRKHLNKEQYLTTSALQGKYICVDFIQGACAESLDSQVQVAPTHPPHP